MILPRKQVSLEESLFGFGAFLLSKINQGVSFGDLWDVYKTAYNNKEYSVKYSFDQYIMAMDFLFIIGAIRQNEEGQDETD